jgi:hypothetical protein
MAASWPTAASLALGFYGECRRVTGRGAEGKQTTRMTQSGQGNELRLTSAVPAHQSRNQVPPERADTSGSCTHCESDCHGTQLPESIHGCQS